MQLLHWTVALSIFLSGADAATTPTGVVAFPVERAAGTALKRRGYTQSDLSGRSASYYVKLALGEPQQQITANLDTGSSNLVVLDKGAASCTKDDQAIQNCKDKGTCKPNTL
jgi:hypothetical protein